MLVGLVRLGCCGSGAFRLGHLLWQQVQLLLERVNNYTHARLSVHEGVIWLLLATVAEVPPVVRPFTVSSSLIVDCHALCRYSSV